MLIGKIFMNYIQRGETFKFEDKIENSLEKH